MRFGQRVSIRSYLSSRRYVYAQSELQIRRRLPALALSWDSACGALLGCQLTMTRPSLSEACTLVKGEVVDKHCAQ